jgi:hypothetical protein
MRHWLIVLISCLSLTVDAAESLRHPITGAPGVWLPRDEAIQVLDAVERKLPKTEAALSACDELQLALKGQVLTATTATQRALDLANFERERADHWEKLYTESVASQGGLLQEPMFWLVTGLVIGGGAIILVR